MKWQEIRSTQTTELQQLGLELKIHPLALEDCFHRDQRAKLEDYENHQLLVWFMFYHNKLYELQFLILPVQILFVPHDAPPATFSSWKDFFQLTGETDKDVPTVLFQILDKVSDISRAEFRSLVDRIDKFEHQLLKGVADLKVILPVKKKLAAIELRTEPHTEVLRQLQGVFQSRNDLKWKFRDLRDHVKRFNERVIFQQGQILSDMDLYWAMAAQRTNLQIKRLTLLASISVPVTFWASFWGMNFQIIPYDNPLFFGFAMLIMALTALGVYVFFKNRGYWQDF